MVAVRQAEGTRGAAAHPRSRGPVERRSRPWPPCRLADATPQTAAPVESQRTATVEAIAACAPCHQWPARHAALAQGHTPIPARAALGDLGGHRVQQDGESFVLSPRWPQGGPRVAPAYGLLGPPGASHAVPPTARQETGGPGSRARGGCAAPPHAAAGAPRLGGVAGMGDRPGQRVATRVLGRGRPQRLALAPAAAAAGPAQAACEGVARPAPLRW